MSKTWDAVKRLVEVGDVRISEHGYDELAEDRILVKDVLGGVRDARVVEDYPGFAKGPAVLVLQRDRDDRPIHVVWGIPRGRAAPAVLVTAYRPHPRRWRDNFLERLK